MKAKSKLAEAHKGTSSLVWPRFTQGLLLQAEDLTQGVDYTRALSRLMFRNLFGCGVVCGLVVTAHEECCKVHIGVACGVALDCCGDPVHVPQDQDLVIDRCCADIPPELWVVLRRVDKCCAPRTAVCSSEEDETPSVCTRVRDGFEIRVLAERPECSCGCQPVDAPDGGGDDTLFARTSGSNRKEALAAGTGDKSASERNGTATAQKDAMTSEPAQTAQRRAVIAHGVVDNPCLCVDPTLDCYREHYAGTCACGCCDCEWIILARLTNTGTEEHPYWTSDHSVRRFVRPVLMRDPQVEREQRIIYAAQQQRIRERQQTQQAEQTQTR